MALRAACSGLANVRKLSHTPEATHWLDIWLDSALTLQENRRRRIGKTQQAEARIRRIVNQYGVPPASAWNLQMPLVQGMMLYMAKLTRSGQKGVEGEYQMAINRVAREALGSFRFTPQGILAAESGLTAARALLDHRQARFAERPCSRPQGGGGAEEVLSREGSALTTRLKVTVEPQVWSEGRPFPGRVFTDGRAQHSRQPGSGGPETPSGPTVPGSIAERWGRRACG